MAQSNCLFGEVSTFKDLAIARKRGVRIGCGEMSPHKSLYRSSSSVAEHRESAREHSLQSLG